MQIRAAPVAQRLAGDGWGLGLKILPRPSNNITNDLRAQPLPVAADVAHRLKLFADLGVGHAPGSQVQYLAGAGLSGEPWPARPNARYTFRIPYANHMLEVNHVPLRRV